MSGHESVVVEFVSRCAHAYSSGEMQLLVIELEERLSRLRLADEQRVVCMIALLDAASRYDLEDVLERALRQREQAELLWRYRDAWDSPERRSLVDRLHKVLRL